MQPQRFEGLLQFPLHRLHLELQRARADFQAPAAGQQRRGLFLLPFVSSAVLKLQRRVDATRPSRAASSNVSARKSAVSP